MNVDYTNLPDDSAITITSFADALAKRTAILQYLWGTSSLPTARAVNVGNIPSSEISTTVKNSWAPYLKSSSKLTVAMELSVTVYAYLFNPTTPNGKAAIVHEGHVCNVDAPEQPNSPNGTFGMTETVQELLFQGYQVVFIFMPHLSPPDCSGAPDVHNVMFDLVPATGHPLKFFLEPVTRVINYLASLTPAPTEYFMTGLSGGGWATALYAAIDPRVHVSVEVAGSAPLHLRPKTASAGDFEQVLPEFYSQFGYPDLYVMACCGATSSDRRRRIQVLNRRDSCCFTGATGDWQDPNWQAHVHAYEAEVQATLAALGTPETFRLDIDDSAGFHQISRATIIGQIMTEFGYGRRRIGAAGGHAFVRGIGGNLWHWDGSAWEDTGVPIVGVPAVIANTEHDVDVFCNSQANEPQHIYKDPTTGAWTVEHMGGTVIGDVAVCSASPGKWDMCAIGMGHNMWQWFRQANGAITFALVGPSNQVLGTPTIASYTANRLDIVARGLDRTLWHYSSSTGRSPWTTRHVGTKTLNDYPTTVVRPNSATLRTYTRGPEGHLWESYWNGSTWAVFDISSVTGSTSTLLSGSPSANADQSTGIVRVVCRTTTGTVATYVLSAQGSWSFHNDQGLTYAAPTAAPGGEYARGADGTLSLFSAGTWQQLGAAQME